MIKENFAVDIEHYSISGAPVFTVAQARQIEAQFGADRGQFPLMQAAALAIVHKMQQEFGADLKNKKWVVVTGNGNNGGDGYEIATNLIALGCSNIAVLSVQPPKMGLCANEARSRYLEAHGLLYALFLKNDSASKAEAELDINPLCTQVIKSADYVVDAIVGIGIGSDFDVTRASAQKTMAAVNLVNEASQAKVLAVDIPSLLNAQTGDAAAPYVIKADYTFSVFGLRPGLLFGAAANYCGRVIAVYPDIGSMAKILQTMFQAQPCLAFDYKGVQQALPMRQATDHKGTAGRVLLVGGNVGMHGALMLSSLGALRTGAGLITACFADAQGQMPLNMLAPEVMTIKPTADKLPATLIKSDAVVLGPGLGRDEVGAKLFATIWTQIQDTTLLVIDADGLWHLRQMFNQPQNDELALKRKLILTPHVGEAAMLLNKSITEVLANSLEAAQQIAKLYSAVCVLKSNRTVVASFDKTQVFVGVVGSPAMASGGMGDLLSGITAALGTQVKDPMVTAVMALAIHGRAGELAGEQEGIMGTCARDLLPYVRLLRNKRER